MTRVAIFTDAAFAESSGVSTTLRAVLKHAPADIRARIYACAARDVDEPDHFAAGSWRIGIPFCRHVKAYVPRVIRLIRQVRQDGADVVHFTTPGPVGLTALAVASRLRRPLMGTFHIDLAGHARALTGSDRVGRISDLYARALYSRCQRVLARSRAARQALIDSGTENVEIWMSGVSTDHFAPARRSQALRDSWGASDRRPVLLYAGSLSATSGLDLLPALTERLQRAQVRHRLVIAGEGPLRSGLSDRCTGAIFTATLSPSQMAIAMASADLLVCPDRMGMAGHIVLEAQASGLPVLVAGEGGARESMVDGQTGYVCADLREFTRRAADLIGDRDHRRRLSREARAFAQTQQWDTTLAPLYQAYREVSASADAGARSGIRPALVSKYSHS